MSERQIGAISLLALIGVVVGVSALTSADLNEYHSRDIKERKFSQKVRFIFALVCMAPAFGALWLTAITG